MSENKEPKPLDEGDINLLRKYGMGPYSEKIKQTEDENKDMVTKINKMCGIKESDTGLSLPSQWDLVADARLAAVTHPFYPLRSIPSPSLAATKYSNPASPKRTST